MKTLGSLCSGYGGLDMGVAAYLGGAVRTAWVSDIEPGPSKLLAHHFPEATNLGDMTEVDWASVEPVDVLVGGTPCQDLSLAGRRAGMGPGTRSGLWESMCNAVEALRPRLVVWENVRGALSAGAFSRMEPGEGCLGGGANVPALRALGRVLGDLAGLGYDAQWVGLPASAVGAPHPRFRIFVAAYPAGDRWWVDNGECGEAVGVSDSPDRTHVEALLLPTPCAQPSGNSPEEHLRKKPGRQRVTDLRILVENDLLKSGGQLLPTPRASDGDKGGPNQRGSKGDYALPGAVVNLLPTPKAGDADFGLPRTSGRPPEKSTALATRLAYTDFGDYAPAIQRWEAATRPAPPPTEPSPRGGQPRLSPAFVEWMMGLPQGWVTSPEIGLTRTQQLRALGNGVVPQQAALALEIMADRETNYEKEAA